MRCPVDARCDSKLFGLVLFGINDFATYARSSLAAWLDRA
jgi:hypothetical protein